MRKVEGSRQPVILEDSGTQGLIRFNQVLYPQDCGLIENSEINDRVVKILGGTIPVFDNRKLKY